MATNTQPTDRFENFPVGSFTPGLSQYVPAIQAYQAAQKRRKSLKPEDIFGYDQGNEALYVKPEQSDLGPFDPFAYADLERQKTTEQVAQEDLARMVTQNRC